MKKFIVLALSLLCLSGCTKAPSEETPTTTTPSIETTPSTTTAIEPINTIEHKFSALWVYGQDCPPGQPCYDVMQRVESGYSMYGQNLHKSEVDSHTTGNRQPQVEDYRIS